jgi:hypothetical protein
MNGVIADPSAPQVPEVESTTPVVKRKPRVSRAKKSPPAKSEALLPPAKSEALLPTELTEALLPLDMPVLARQESKVLSPRETTVSSRGRGRPVQDKWATAEARVRGGEFASKDSKADLAIFVSRTLKADPSFKPAMGVLMRSLGYEDMVSVFGL